MKDLQYTSTGITNYPDKEERKKRHPDMISYMNDSQIREMNRLTTKGSDQMREVSQEGEKPNTSDFIFYPPAVFSDEII